MIPKTIHYCWFGGNPLPKLAKKCIKSWKKHCKGYEIIEWNENNFDIASAPLFVRQAYDAKKYAFVSDYVRLYVMVKYGGIYMDTDVEVIKPLDSFLKHEAFSGFEDEYTVPTGIMACVKGYHLFKELLSFYDTAKFINDDGTYNMISNVIMITEMCVEHGLKRDNTFQIIDGFALYPNDFFCPIKCETGILTKTKNTTAIHWFAASWLSKEKTKARKGVQIEAQKANRKHRIRTIPNRILKCILGERRYEKLKNRFKKV